jgi:hypothetical protein
MSTALARKNRTLRSLEKELIRIWTKYRVTDGLIFLAKKQIRKKRRSKK